jgi:hypothetical protein
MPWVYAVVRWRLTALDEVETEEDIADEPASSGRECAPPGRRRDPEPAVDRGSGRTVRPPTFATTPPIVPEICGPIKPRSAGLPSFPLSGTRQHERGFDRGHASGAAGRLRRGQLRARALTDSRDSRAGAARGSARHARGDGPRRVPLTALERCRSRGLSPACEAAAAFKRATKTDPPRARAGPAVVESATTTVRPRLWPSASRARSPSAA